MMNRPASSRCRDEKAWSARASSGSKDRSVIRGTFVPSMGRGGDPPVSLHLAAGPMGPMTSSPWRMGSSGGCVQ